MRFGVSLRKMILTGCDLPEYGGFAGRKNPDKKRNWHDDLNKYRKWNTKILKDNIRSFYKGSYDFLNDDEETSCCDKPKDSEEDGYIVCLNCGYVYGQKIESEKI